MKTHNNIKYSLIFIGLYANLAYAEFIPNPIIMETSKGVKPSIMLILDNSGSMVIASPTPTHATASWMSRAEMLHESVVYLADKYVNDANFGISILNAQNTYLWPTYLPKGQVLNATLSTVLNKPNPDDVYDYNNTTYGYYRYISSTGIAPAYSNWNRQRMESKSSGIIMNIDDLELPANMNKFKKQMREVGPYNGTYLGTAVTAVRNYFAANTANPKPIQYRCQQNHILMFTDGNATNGDYPLASAKIAWDTNYLPTSGLDKANKPWNSEGKLKQNISFHGIYFGPEKIGTAENPAFTNLKAAAVPSKGMVVNADSLDSLKVAFAKILNSIVLTRSGTGGTYGAEDPLNLTNANKADLYYSTSFSFQDWTGTIDAINPDGSINWTSKDTIKFANESGTYPTVFKTLNGSTEEIIQPHATEAARDAMDWLIGYKMDGKLRMRSTPVSDIIGSVINYAGKGLTLTAKELAASAQKTKWETYATAKKNNFVSRLVVGSNDGLYNMVDPKTGKRTHAFLPPSMRARVADVADPNYKHSFGIDGVTTVADVLFDTNSTPKTIAITGYGGGGKGLFAMQLFDGTSSEPKILWEKNDLGGLLGYTYGQPQLVRTSSSGEAYRLLVANGYDSSEKKSCLIELDPSTGDNTARYCVKNPGGVETKKGYGLSSPAIITNETGILQYAYAGDLAGNLWKFNFTNSADVSVTKLFTDINNRPITTKPLILKKENDLFIVFGSGKYMELSDRIGAEEKKLHYVYGILDTNQEITQDQLVEQSMKPIAGSNYFEVTQNPVDYSTKKGWYLPLAFLDASNNLVLEGDRLIYDPQEYGINDLLRFSLTSYSNVESVDPCLPSDAKIKGKLLRILPFTGGMASKSTIDTNKDGKIDSSDKIVAGELLSAPTGTAEIRNYTQNGDLVSKIKATTNSNAEFSGGGGGGGGDVCPKGYKSELYRDTNGEWQTQCVDSNGRKDAIPRRVYLRDRF